MPLGPVISIAGRARSVFFNKRLKPFGLSAGQVPVLMLLYHKQNIMQDALVRHYRLDKGTIARAVKKLEDGGFVTRITDPENRRAVRLFLTEKGGRAAPVIIAIDREWEAAVCAGLSGADKETLQGLVRRVTQNSLGYMQDEGDGPRA